MEGARRRGQWAWNVNCVSGKPLGSRAAGGRQPLGSQAAPRLTRNAVLIANSPCLASRESPGPAFRVCPASLVQPKCALHLPSTMQRGENRFWVFQGERREEKKIKLKVEVWERPGTNKQNSLWASGQKCVCVCVILNGAKYEKAVLSSCPKGQLWAKGFLASLGRC